MVPVGLAATGQWAFLVEVLVLMLAGRRESYIAQPRTWIAIGLWRRLSVSSVAALLRGRGIVVTVGGLLRWRLAIAIVLLLRRSAITVPSLRWIARSWRVLLRSGRALVPVVLLGAVAALAGEERHLEEVGAMLAQASNEECKVVERILATRR